VDVNFLNKLRESDEDLGFPNGMEEKSAREVLSQFLSRSTDAVCFDLGDIESLGELQAIPSLSRLPYPVCWFEWNLPIPPEIYISFLAKKGDVEDWPQDGPDQTKMGCLIDQSDDKTRISCFHYNRLDRFCLQAYAESGPDSFEPSTPLTQIPLSTFLPEDHGTWQFIKYNLDHVCGFLSALHCNNVKRVLRTPPEKLQRARKKRGKPPLFSYWVLVLSTPSAESSEGVGGIHSSPRLHLRRGHPRQYSPGKFTWVQPHVVGNKSLGMVHKDYAASEGFGAHPASVAT
jgi:hypothetical protein